MRPLSPSGMSVLSDMVQSQHRGQTLREAYFGGRIDDAEDLKELVGEAWLYDDSPMDTESEAEWLEIFGATGYFEHPSPHEARSAAQERPVESLTVYRGAVLERKLRMSWATARTVALEHGQRQAKHCRKDAALYEAIAPPDAILAILYRKSDGGATIVVNLAKLTNVRLVEAIPYRPAPG